MVYLIEALELVQNNSARSILYMITIEQQAFTAMKNSLQMTSLSSRRKFFRLCLFHKIFHNSPHLRASLFLSPSYVSSHIDHAHKSFTTRAHLGNHFNPEEIRGNSPSSCSSASRPAFAVAGFPQRRTIMVVTHVRLRCSVHRNVRVATSAGTRVRKASRNCDMLVRATIFGRVANLVYRQRGLTVKSHRACTRTRSCVSGKRQSLARVGPGRHARFQCRAFDPATLLATQVTESGGATPACLLRGELFMTANIRPVFPNNVTPRRRASGGTRETPKGKSYQARKHTHRKKTMHAGDKQICNESANSISGKWKRLHRRMCVACSRRTVRFCVSHAVGAAVAAAGVYSVASAHNVDRWPEHRSVLVEVYIAPRGRRRSTAAIRFIVSFVAAFRG
ncbi:hypothetical protein HPB51_000119 [Rhipicephalus microplus]|uniref:Uncharacterized protein n=1 Tax=Rhipicephalus microplus TaxID=6941 RepID=A0A9J6EVA5_RHIMP|nr:hypothetical protein HPB51_000119 [Rhipicephalus microplus]